MKFIFLFLGKTREQYLARAIDDYAARLRRYVPVEIQTYKEKHTKNDTDQVIMQKEAAILLDHCAPSAYTVALDPGGVEHTSEGLAEIIKKWEHSGQRSIHFLIGGYLGLDNSISQRADETWSLSRLTFTHEMTRFILMEQLYRACSIKAGHNYHK